jgi:secreted trypsin-like serine protease
MAAIPSDLDLGTRRSSARCDPARCRSPRRSLVATALAAALVCVACLLPAGASAAGTGGETAVIGGAPAPISSFPFMARITAHDSVYQYTCTGSVIAPNMILTAAHCLLNEAKTAYLNPATFQVLTGTGSLAVPGTVSGVERVVVDPGYTPSTGWHDAGLIQLSAPIAAPGVRLASTQTWVPGTTGYAVGWGLDEAGELPVEMRVGETAVQSAEYCQSQIGSIFHSSLQLCSIDAPTYSAGTCNGDSGGPLLMVSGGELVEIGITSLGPQECQTDLPRIDTRVDAEYGWIARELAAHPATAPTPVTTPTTAAPKTTTTTPAATPAPAPAPAATPKLPKLTLAVAKRNTFTVLRTDRRIGSRFRVHNGYQSSCQSTSATTAICTVRWFSGPDDYWGTVTIFEEFEGTTPVWNYRYSVRAVDDWCYWRSGHRGTCRTTTYRA